MRVLAATLALVLAAPAFASVALGTKAAASTPAPIATRVALAALRDGGSAVDAAVAAQWVLAVIRPQVSGIGGGGFLLYYEKKSGAVWALDFRETAPRQLPKRGASTTSAASLVAVPGVVAGLAAAHDRFGSLPWPRLLEPALMLARGTTFDATVSDELAVTVKDRANPKNTFFVNGEVVRGATVLTQDALARTFTRLAEHGARDFYDGSLARALVTELRGAGSTLTLRDLRDYAPQWRAPLRVDFAEEQIYTAPPPSRAGFILAATLGALRSADLQKGLDDPATIHLVAEAVRRAEADARQNVGDPSRARAAYAELLSPQRLEALGAAIDRTKVTASTTLLAAAEERQPIRSSDIVVTDEKGNIACLSTSLGAATGSGFFSAAGFFLNDALADFDSSGLANAAEGGRRPASPLSPLIIVRRSAPIAAIGTSGGSANGAIGVQLALDTAYFGADLDAAIDAPRFRQSLFPDELQYERVDAEILRQLGAFGHSYAQRLAIGAVQAIAFGEKLRAISDRRSGGAAGAY